MFNIESYGQLPLSFEANQGQTNAQVNFLARGSGYALFLTPEEAVLVLRGQFREKQPVNSRLAKQEEQFNRKAKNAVLRTILLGANRQPMVEGQEELPGKANYFIGNDPARWRTDIPTYARVKYRDVYPGVDMIYYGNQGQLEWDFVVTPGTNPAGIILEFQEIDHLEANENGDLVLQASGEEIHLRKPFIYQEVDGARREIPGGYVVKDRNRIGFQLGEYDTTRPLVIDPVLVYSTYLGGSGLDEGRSIAGDLFGNAYITGGTGSANFPTPNALQPDTGGSGDVFVIKIDPFGSTFVYSTYLGSSGFDVGNGIAVDLFGNAYVTGNTNSTNFPTFFALQPTLGGDFDAFVTKINAFGTGLVYSTYLGGSGFDQGLGIAADLFGNAYVTGSTDSLNFPTFFALQPTFGGGLADAFVTKISAFGFGLIYSTYLGGSREDAGFGIAVDLFGNAYVTGRTSSLNFPIFLALQPALTGGLDAFVTKVNAFGSGLVYSTYLGGSDFDSGEGIVVDLLGNAYVAGSTNSLDFPTPNALQPTFGGVFDAFITKVSPVGSGLVYSTYLGGSSNDSGNGIAVDILGNAYVTGRTNSLNFPTQNALQPVLGGSNDAYVTKLNALGSSLVYSTYLGGSGDDFGSSIAVDLSGNAYVTGFTNSPNFPTENAMQLTLAGSLDAFITKITDFPPV